MDHDPHIPQVLKNTAIDWENEKVQSNYKLMVKATSQKWYKKSTHHEWKMVE